MPDQDYERGQSKQSENNAALYTATQRIHSAQVVALGLEHEPFIAK